MCDKWFVIYGKRKGTEERKVIQSFKQKWQAERMCEQWGWEYCDENHSYWMDIEESAAYKESEI